MSILFMHRFAARPALTRPFDRPPKAKEILAAQRLQPLALHMGRLHMRFAEGYYERDAQGAFTDLTGFREIIPRLAAC